MKYLLVLFCLTGITAIATLKKTKAKFVIKKCCPLDQELSYGLSCVNITRKLKDAELGSSRRDEIVGKSPTEIIFPSKDYDIRENFSRELSLSWFPFFSVINASTLKPASNLDSLRELIGMMDVEYGARPKCRANEKDSSCFKLGLSEQFRILLGPDRTMRLYISKKSSYHSEANFNVETRDCLRSGEGGKGKENIEGRSAESLFELNELRTFPLEHVCIDRGPEETFFAEYCPCEYISCLRKCCRDNEIFDEGKGKCTFDPVHGNWRPRLENGTLKDNYYLLSNTDPSDCKSSDFKSLQRLSKGCQSFKDAVDPKRFYFLSDGSLKIANDKAPLSPKSFCGDNVLSGSEILENVILTCAQKDFSSTEIYISGILPFLSGFFLLVLTALCLYVPELRDSIFNKAIICHNASILLGDFILGLNHVLPGKMHDLCVAFNLIIQYFFMSSFFWMNIMCLIISLQLRDFKEADKREVKFLLSAIYAWGAPLVVVVITTVLGFVPSMPSSLTKPNFSCYDCASDSDSLATVIYFYAPMIAVISFNAILFACNIIQFRNAKKLAKADGKDSSEILLNEGRKRLVIFAKLFAIMGFTWAVEIILKTLFLNDKYGRLLSDIFTILRASLIFIILACRRKFFLSLLNKLKFSSEDSSDGGSIVDEITYSDELENIKRRERILRKQITQTFRRSDQSLD